MTAVTAIEPFVRHISVSVIDPDMDFRNQITRLLQQASGYSCLHTYRSGEAALYDIFTQLPAVLLINVSLPGMSGIDCAKSVKEKAPGVEIIMLTGKTEDARVFDSLSAGASGYMNRNIPPGKMLDAITEAYRGGAPMSRHIARMVVNSFRQSNFNPFHLTPREMDVLQELCKGKSYKMAADSLYVSQDTIRSHIKNLYRKMQVNSKSEAVIKAMSYRLV